jgi:O-antigen/teichoic acid export membrane protein
MAASAISAMLLCVEVGVLGSDVAMISAFPRFRSSPAVLLNTAITLGAISACAGGLIVIGLGAVGLRALHFLVAHPADGVAFLLLVLFQAGWWLMDQAAIALRRSDHVPVRAFVAATVTLSGVVALGAAGFNTAGSVLLAWAAAALIACLIGLVQISKAIGGYRFRFGLANPLWRQLVRVGLPNFLVTAADIAPGLMLPIVAAQQLSPRYAAYWYTVWMMAFAAYSIPWSFACVATLGLIVLGPAVLSILGPAYRAHGAIAVRIAALAAIPMVVMKAYLFTCRATGRLREGTLVATATGTIAVTLAIILAPGMRLPGIAVAWLGVQTAGAVVAAIRLRTFALAPQRVESSAGPMPREPTPEARVAQ